MFWRRWTREYLPILQIRQKWHNVQRNLAKNDIVLVVDKATSRNLWPLGIVLDVSVGRDGLVRSARIKTMSSEMVRPIEKLCLLEAHEENKS